MSKRWYAVQLGDETDCGIGSTRKREAMNMCRKLHRLYPGERIRICVCRVDNDFCEEEITVYSSSN